MIKNKRQQAYAMFAVGGLLIVGIIGWNFVLHGQPKPNSLGCIGDPARSTVVVIDQTDGLASQTQGEIYRRVQSVINDDSKVLVGERVSVFTIDDLSRRDLKPRFEHCKLPSKGNDFTDSSKWIALKKDKEFDKPLRSALATVIAGANQSTIAEAISDLSRTHYLRASEKSRLLIYSDLLQHSSAVSLYGCDSGVIAINKYKSARVGGVQRPSFKNLQVILNPVPRVGLNAANAQCRAIFWNWFFGDNKGSSALLEVDPLPGPVGP